MCCESETTTCPKQSWGEVWGCVLRACAPKADFLSRAQLAADHGVGQLQTRKPQKSSKIGEKQAKWETCRKQVVGEE